MRRLPPYDTAPENRYANLRVNPSNLGPAQPLHNLLHRFTRSPSSPRSTFSSREGGEGRLSFRRYFHPLHERRAKGCKAGLAGGFEGSVFLRPRLCRGEKRLRRSLSLPFALESNSLFFLLFFSFRRRVVDICRGCFFFWETFSHGLEFFLILIDLSFNEIRGKTCYSIFLYIYFVLNIFCIIKNIGTLLFKVNSNKNCFVAARRRSVSAV